jgi:hypothetical protein
MKYRDSKSNEAEFQETLLQWKNSQEEILLRSDEDTGVRAVS